MTELARYETRDQVATVTLDSPHNRNALTMALIGEMTARIGTAAADPSVRAVVLTHTGRVFCAGADLKTAGSGADPDRPGAEAGHRSARRRRRSWA